MTVIIIVLIFIGFVGLDILVRRVSRRIALRRALSEREAILRTAVRLEVADEAKSLVRAEVPDARASILAVDDEPVVLDSLRKILVLDGYSVDTVENGPEALNLVQRRNYDFVFTDLKMPGMDGVEVVKAVHHLRPDTDMAVITGFATIESAVETMQHGAVAYVQKPFTADELSEFVKGLVIKREARHEAQRRPSVRVVAPDQVEGLSEREFCVPGGAFIFQGHTWVRLEPDGQIRVGLDDFARKALGHVEALELPEVDRQVRRGDPLFSVRRGTHMAQFVAPLSGSVAWVNVALRDDPSAVDRNPYGAGWVCLLEPADLAGELPGLRVGEPVVRWYQEEIERLRQAGGPAAAGAPAVDWGTIEERFLKPAASAPGRH